METIIRRIFVSYTEADKKYANKIRLWAKRNKLGAGEVQTLVEGELLRRKKPSARPGWSVDKKIAYADVIIVLFGDNNADHPWLRFEPQAQEGNLLRFYMRIPYTHGAIPTELGELKQMAYNPNALVKLFQTLPPKEIPVQTRPQGQQQRTNNKPPFKRKPRDGQQQQQGQGQGYQGKPPHYKPRPQRDNNTDNANTGENNTGENQNRQDNRPFKKKPPHNRPNNNRPNTGQGGSGGYHKKPNYNPNYQQRQQPPVEEQKPKDTPPPPPPVPKYNLDDDMRWDV